MDAATPQMLAVPAWYVEPEYQCAKVMRLSVQYGWGFRESDIPAVPEPSMLRPGEVLLLDIRLDGSPSGMHFTFEALLQAIKLAAGHTKIRRGMLREFPVHDMYLVPGYPWELGLRWVAFHPGAYRGLDLEQALQEAQRDGLRCANTEVLAAAVLFPGWPLSWAKDDGPYPGLASLNVQRDWLCTPYLSFRGNGLELSTYSFYSDNRSCICSPTVREC